MLILATEKRPNQDTLLVGHRNHGHKQRNHSNLLVHEENIIFKLIQVDE